MKKFPLILSLASIGAMGLFTACSDDSEPDPTRAELCATGLTAECLVGEWAANGMANTVSGEMLAAFNYTANPGKLTFSKDGQFEYAPAAASKLAKSVDVVYGSWTIDGTTLRMVGGTNSLELSSATKTLTPTIKVNGAFVEMSFGALWFMNNETDEAAIRTTSTEVFSISAD